MSNPSDRSDDSTPTSDEQALWEDLKAAYTNPEIYYNPNEPQIFIMPIRSLFLSGNPTLIYAEINGAVFPTHFVELMKDLITRSPHLDDELRQYGETLEQHLDAFMSDPNLSEFRDEMWRFFLRHFPKFMMSAFGIAALSAMMRTALMMWRREPDSQLNEMEKIASETLKTHMAAFEKLTKQVVETRSTTGRPKNVYGTGELPEIVRTVVQTAIDIMGDARGKEVVPGLKAVAMRLGTNEGALSRRLRLAGHPWTGIRTWLENLPPNAT